MLTEKTPAELVAYIGRLMFARRLTDIAGGNVSLRAGGVIYCTPRYAGQRWHWQLQADDILPLESSLIEEVMDLDLVRANQALSREIYTHLAIYGAFPEVGGIIHAHPRHVLPFCAQELPIEPVLEAAERFGVLTYHAPAPPYSWEQAQAIVGALLEKREHLRQDAAAVLMPRHGILVAGVDLWAAIEALEVIDLNAWCLIAGKMLRNRAGSKPD